MTMTDEATDRWAPVLTNPASRTPWQIGRIAADRLELTAARYETWALANDDAEVLNEAISA